MKLPLNLAMERVEQPELLDLGHGTDGDVAENLAEMHRMNNVLGGTYALTRHLYPLLRAHRNPVRLLDIGAGGCGLPQTILDWANRAGVSLQVYALDWSRRNLRAAKGNTSRSKGAQQIRLVQADALHQPLPEESVDYIISSLFLHHLKPAEMISLLKRSYTTARCGLIMSDLVRGRLPYLAFQMVRPLFARNYLTRHDGAVSIRRAYTPGELRTLAERAGLPNPQVFVHWPWRMTLVVQK